MNADPHPECPECGGHGIETPLIADTRKLKPSGRRLYAGVQKTKDGLKVIMRDQDAALSNLSSYLGMKVERREISGPGGKPLSLVSLKAEDLTDDELAAVIAGSNDDDSDAPAPPDA
jgi:phage terminase small subunit